MLIRLLVVFASLLLVNSSFAQESDVDIWNWAFNDDSGELFAYSEYGEVNVLLSNLTGWVDELWRISNTQALGIIDVADGRSLYLLDDDSAEPIALTFDGKQFDLFLDEGYRLRFEVYQPPYMIFTSWNPLRPTFNLGSAIILNLSTRQVDLLTDSTYSVFRVTPDQERLRYVHVNDNDDVRKTELRERPLVDNTEQILNVFSGEVWVHNSDINNDRWLLREDDSNGDLLHYRIFNVTSGVDDIIYSQDPDEYLKSYVFLGEDLISYRPICVIGCLLDLKTINGDTFYYPLSTLGGHISDFFKTNDNNLIVGGDYGYWLLHTNAPPEFIGHNYVGGSHRPASLSPDKRFALIAEKENHIPSQRMMIDMETQQVIVTLPEEFENPAYMTYVREGFIVNTGNKGTRIMYRYSTGEIIELPDIGIGNYYEILPDGNVLYSVVARYGMSNLFRYDPYNNTTTLLMENVIRSHIIDVRPDTVDDTQTLASR